MGFLEMIEQVNGVANTFVWTTIGVWLLLGVGVLMTVLTKFFQVTHFGHWMKETVGKLFSRKVIGHSKEKASISQFQALCTALAATVGVGNIAGVSAAILTGGPGAVFWMWVAAFFGMMTNYSENVLGIYYRRKNAQGEWSGGAMYYLQDGLGKKRGMKWVGKVLAIVFACCAVLASFGIGNMGQVNKIVTNLTAAFDIEALSSVTLFGEGASSVSLYALIVGVVIMLIVGVVVLGGLKRIANVAEKIVPVMVLLFVLGSLVIIGCNYSDVLPAFKAIFSSAFTGKAAWGGVTGLTLKTVVELGCKRGVFSNEAGLGSSVMVHSNSNVREPVRQGLWGIFEVFVDTIIVCTMTALVVLTSGVIDLQTGVAVTTSDSTLVAEAFNTIFTFGGIKVGQMFVAVAILLFAFTTVLGWSHYGTKAVEYLAGKRANVVTKVYKVIFVVMILSGALMTSSLAWDVSDTFNGMMMIPNLIGVIALAPLVMKITRNYTDRKLKGKDVKPMYSYSETIQAETEAAVAKEAEEE